jgi:hypothetical protein
MATTVVPFRRTVSAKRLLSSLWLNVDPWRAPVLDPSLLLWPPTGQAPSLRESKVGPPGPLFGQASLAQQRSACFVHVRQAGFAVTTDLARGQARRLVLFVRPKTDPSGLGLSKVQEIGPGPLRHADLTSRLGLISILVLRTVCTISKTPLVRPDNGVRE